MSLVKRMLLSLTFIIVASWLGIVLLAYFFPSHLIYYRGYGNSEGRPTEQGTYLDADAAWAYLTETRGVQAGEIIVMGRSLGAAIAISLAEQNSPGLLVVESAFTSVADMAERLYPILPVRWISRIHYPSIDRIPNV